MKKIMFFLFSFPLLIGASPSIDDLPWVYTPEDEALKIAEDFLPENPVILEAGICGAEHTCIMKKRWPDSKIYGFEAHPELFLRAKDQVSHLEGVVIYPMALFDRVGEVPFYLSSTVPAASSLLKDNLHAIEVPEDIRADFESNGNYKDTQVIVNCTTVDNWAEKNEITKIDYIWLDAEGAELYILQHAKKILSTVRVISTEVNFKEFRLGMTFFDDLYEFLTNQGFVLKSIWGRNDWQATAIFVNKSLLS